MDVRKSVRRCRDVRKSVERFGDVRRGMGSYMDARNGWSYGDSRFKWSKAWYILE